MLDAPLQQGFAQTNPKYDLNDIRFFWPRGCFQFSRDEAKNLVKYAGSACKSALANLKLQGSAKWGCSPPLFAFLHAAYRRLRTAYSDDEDADC